MVFCIGHKVGTFSDDIVTTVAGVTVTTPMSKYLNHSATSADMLTVIPRVKNLDKEFRIKIYHLFS